MGIDANIMFRAEGDIDSVLSDWPDGLGGIKAFSEPYECYDASDCVATHYVNCCCRYFGEGDGRGPGGLIVQALMALVRCKNVKQIWYGGDHNKWATCDSERVLDIAAEWMKNED
jgi:hypothetical protein